MPYVAQSSASLFAWVWRGYLNRHKGLLFIAFIFMVIEGSMLGALAYLMQPMFDRVFVAGEHQLLYVVGGVVIGIVTVVGVIVVICVTITDDIIVVSG